MSLYTSDPAPPVLAHTLLSQPVQNTKDPSAPTERTCSLVTEIKQGIKCSSHALFHPGIVIGFSRPRRRGTGGDDDHGYMGQIPRYILTKHLERTSPAPGSFNTFIVHPFNLTIFSPQNLLTSLLSTNPTPTPSLSRKEAITRLDAVQLLPVYDFSEAMQAITQVSDTLHQIGEQRKHQQLTTQYPVVLIIAGLDTLVESVIRASNPIKGTAVLSAALRMLTRLSREYAAFLSVLLINTSGLGLGTGMGDIAVADGDYQGEQLSVLLPSLLMKTLDQGTDTHLLVSRERGRAGRVGVEVIKDRVGDWLGTRCVWDG
ncbi:uncharacterized protein ACHE_21202A [Aspergillus chevalieri]|uniref:Uncharacterized protein n=1 Tax=Aspergillus chevalieri TaxID=182096 RepID=A0A7R7ZLL9_ASPCH|nr:uncharacterized protein ACHE_21202A [Aspergillus chevalieri]BCR85744.1 hypothetical protein ACHE_21202A [Aspergillus chevalieri]